LEAIANFHQPDPHARVRHFFFSKKALTCAKDLTDDDGAPGDSSRGLALRGWALRGWALGGVRPSARAYLLADPTVACWEGRHLPLAAAAAVGLTFYVRSVEQS
jgi:hypothetical protein